MERYFYVAVEGSYNNTIHKSILLFSTNTFPILYEIQDATRKKNTGVDIPANCYIPYCIYEFGSKEEYEAFTKHR